MGRVLCLVLNIYHKTPVNAGYRQLGEVLTLAKEFLTGQERRGPFCWDWTSEQLVTAAPSQVRELRSPEGVSMGTDCWGDHSIPSFPPQWVWGGGSFSG